MEKLYWKAFGVWFLLISMGWNLVLLPIVVTFIPWSNMGQFIAIWILGWIPVTAVMTGTIVSKETRGFDGGYRAFVLKAMANDGRRWLWFANPIGVVYLFAVYVIWHRFLLPLTVMIFLVKANLFTREEAE